MCPQRPTSRTARDCHAWRSSDRRRRQRRQTPWRCCSCPMHRPPVPTISMASGGAATRNIFSRMVSTAPVISSTVSPRTRSARRKPPICEGVASPDIMTSKACLASSRDERLSVGGFGDQRLERGHRRRAPSSPSGTRKKILQNLMPVLGGDALGVKLHAVNGQRFMLQSHDRVARFGGHFEAIRQAVGARPVSE